MDRHGENAILYISIACNALASSAVASAVRSSKAKKGLYQNYCYSMARQDRKGLGGPSFFSLPDYRPTIANIDLRSYKMAFDLRI